jgi:hypothetical protein
MGPQPGAVRAGLLGRYDHFLAFMHTVQQLRGLACREARSDTDFRCYWEIAAILPPIIDGLRRSRCPPFCRSLDFVLRLECSPGFLSEFKGPIGWLKVVVPCILAILR